LRGLILIDYKPWDGSENVAGKLVAAKVSREEMLNRLGREHFYRGEYEQAVRYFKEVVENYPDWPPFRSTTFSAVTGRWARRR